MPIFADETTANRDKLHNSEPVHPLVSASSTPPAFIEHSKGILSPESVQMDLSLTSFRSRSHSVPVIYPSTTPSPAKSTLPAYCSFRSVPILPLHNYSSQAGFPLVPITPPPSFTGPPKPLIHGPHSGSASPSPPSYHPVPRLVASKSSSTSTRSSACTSSGASMPLFSTDLSALGAGLSTFEDKESELGASVMPSYSTFASHPSPPSPEASDIPIIPSSFATDTTSVTLIKEPYLSSIHSNYKPDGSPFPRVWSDQYLKWSLPSSRENAGDTDTDTEHDQPDLHPCPPVMSHNSRCSRAATISNFRSASITGLTTASEDETDVDDYPYPRETEGDEEARTAAIVVAEEGRALIVHGEGRDVSAMDIPAGTTHILLTSSATPNLVPSLLSQVLPNVAYTLLALDISGNEIRALPSALAHCTQLTELNIARNPLYNLPIWLSGLKGLRVLIADATEISTLPPELVALKMLNVLSIRRNKMMSLPPWLAYLPALEQLEVENNPFQGPWKVLSSLLMTARQTAHSATLPNDYLKTRYIYSDRDYSLYNSGLSMYADASSSHLSIMPSDSRRKFVTPNTATNPSFGTAFSSESELSSLSLNASDQDLTNGPRLIQDEGDNTIVSRLLMSPSKSSLSAASPGLTPPISLTPLTGNSVLTSLSSPSLLPYTSSPVSRSSDIEEALTNIGTNTLTCIQRAPTSSFTDRRTPSPCLRPLSRNRSTPNRPRLSAGSANVSVATFVAKRGNARSRTSSAASQRPLTDYTNSRYNQPSVEDSGYYGNATEYGCFHRQSEGSDLSGGLRSNNPGPSKSELEEKKKTELRRMRSADELRHVYGTVIRPSEPIAPKTEANDDNGGEITETDWRPFFSPTLDAQLKSSQLQTTDIPAGALVLNNRLAAKKYASLSATQGLSNIPVRRRRTTLAEGLFDSDAGMEADGEDEEKRKAQVISISGKVNTPQKPLKGKWGFLKKMSMGRMRLDSPVPRLIQSGNGLSPLRSTQTSPQSAVSPWPQLPSMPISTGSIPRPGTRSVLSSIPSLSAGSSGVAAQHTSSLFVPPTVTSRAAKRRSFLPLDGPPSLNIPIPTTSPFFTDELITPSEDTEEEQTKMMTVQRPSSNCEGLTTEKFSSQTHQPNQARALRSVIAYLRDMADLSISNAPVVGNFSCVARIPANLASTSLEGAEGRSRRPMITEGSQSISESLPSSSYLDESRVYTASMAPDEAGSGKGEDDRSKYKEDKLRRVKIIREIIQTERTYVKGLHELIDIYVKPAALPINTLGNAVAGTKETVIPQHERKMVFNGLDSLYSFHIQSFLPALERAAKPIILEKTDGKAETDSEMPAEVSMDVAVAIAQVFVTYAAFMKMYSTYINNFDTAFERLKHWTQDRRAPGSSITSPNASTIHLVGPGSNVINSNENSASGLQPLRSNQRRRIKQYLKRCRMNPRHSQISLEAYLLLPIQRIPRYRMLLDELVRCTPPKPDLPSDVMERALSEIASLANNMNEGKREAESRRRLVQWQTRIRGKFPSPLVQPHRRLIMDGSLTLTRVVRKTSMTSEVTDPESDVSTVQVECLALEETPRSLVGILCNDLLVLCKDPSSGKDQTAQVDLWAVLRMQTRPLPASITQGNSLRIIDNKAILYFDTQSTSDALTWCRAINMHIPVTF